jgi:hypothetical protein
MSEIYIIVNIEFNDIEVHEKNNLSDKQIKNINPCKLINSLILVSGNYINLVGC